MMVRPTDDGINACALTIVTAHARRPPLTVVAIPPAAMTTTVTAIITGAIHTDLRETTRATTDKVTTTTAGVFVVRPVAYPPDGLIRAIFCKQPIIGTQRMWSHGWVLR